MRREVFRLYMAACSSKMKLFAPPYLLFRQTGLPYISEKPPDKSVDLPCISEMRAMHIEVMMFCLYRRAGHPCRKHRSKRVRRPWRRDVLRRGNRLVQGFPRSVRDYCSEDGFGPHESLHHHRSRKSNESHPHRPCRTISSHHTHHTNDAQSDRHPTTTETSNAVGLLAN